MTPPDRLAVTVQVERVYLKDLSFESPHAPQVFASEWKPNVHLDINTTANRISPTHFEVVLRATLSARPQNDEDTTALIIEVQQAGVFLIEGAEGPALERILAVACPDILFPYVREAVDNVASKGTFPPFMLAPVDFASLYEQALRNRGAGREDNVN